ncbi:MAG: MEDS domain-containing protein, partial [Nitrospira sp.]
PVSRHQCLVYAGSPAPHLLGLSALIRQKLEANYRCLFLNSPAMVTGMRSYLLAAGTDVTKEIVKGSLVLSSSNAHLVEGCFIVDRMLGMLEDALHQALHDGYQGLFATGDMSREFGPERDFSKLLEYEWRLEELLRAHPALSGICQYHADTLGPDVLRHGLMTHPALYINDTLSRLNPLYVKRESFAAQLVNTPALDTMIRELCTVPDTLSLAVLPPNYLL